MSPRLSSIALCALSCACTSSWQPLDADGDGASGADGDCWDAVEGPEGSGLTGADIGPGVAETWYDGFDADCAGDDDFDADGDLWVPLGYGGAETVGVEGSGQLPVGDCWDALAAPPDGVLELDGLQVMPEDVNPGVAETWYDGLDADCAGDDDFDADADGYESADHAGPDGDFGTDCDDADPARYPDESIEEVWYDGFDDNCDGNDGDADGDGWYDADYAWEVPAGYEPGDCWDDPDTTPDEMVPVSGDGLAAADVHPGATDAWYDGVDADCDAGDDFDADADGYDSAFFADRDGRTGDDCIDGSVWDDANPAGLDPEDVHPGAEETWYDGTDADCADDSDDDADGDGVEARGHGGFDCDDGDPLIYPLAPERCATEADDDCDGDTNDEGALGCAAWWLDADEDGFGDDGDEACLCEASGDYTATVGGDCLDSDADVNPDADEVCNEIDDDCDDLVDLDDDSLVGLATWYLDLDGDGYGTAVATLEQCEVPLGYADNADDCDDGDDAIHPGADEVCDDADVDEDCDDLVDDDDDVTGTTTFYLDDDGDGFGDEFDAGSEWCDPPSDYAVAATDCDDSDDAVSPGASESCATAYDDDCDGDTNDVDALECTAYYGDGDGDDFGDSDETACLCEATAAYPTDDATDCDDSDAAVNPGATEDCSTDDDDDCSGSANDEDAVGCATRYADVDGDGYGSSTSSACLCEATASYSATEGGDCAVYDADVSPGASEVCDDADTDEDCSGAADDDDPGVTDASDWYVDADGDGYGEEGSAPLAWCDPPSDVVATDDDCDDDDPAINPTAREVSDGVDNDCDGETDESTWTGTGADGALSVTGYTDLSTTDAPAWGVNAISGDEITLDSSSAGLAAGDEVLIINLQGSTGATSSVGTFEFADVAGASGTTLTLAADVVETYGQVSNADLSGQVVVVQRVPQYTDVTVADGARLYVAAWDGETGGVLALRATGTILVEDGGAITVASRGYEGGGQGSHSGCDGYQGESYAGTGIGGVCGSTYNESIGGYQSNLGGGGCNITGGGGEHAGGASAGTVWTGGYTAPEAGDTYGTAALSTLFMGSGGGGTYFSSSTGGPGGAGGGIIYLGADTIELDGMGGVLAKGETATAWSTGSYTYGTGGGAGGSIWLQASALDLADDSVRAVGGPGVSSTLRAGGDGGDGRIRVDYATLGGLSYGAAGTTTLLEDACEPDPGYSGAL